MAVAGAEFAFIIISTGWALLRLDAVAVRTAAHEATDRVVALASTA